MKIPPTPTEIKQHYAGVFIVTESGKIIGQRRDNKPNIDNPNKISTFGGTVDPGEGPHHAAWRELVQEETNLKVDPKDIIFLCQDISWRELTQEWEVKHFYYVLIKDEDIDSLEIYEGQGWAYIKGPDDPDLVPAWVDATKAMVSKLK